jgi:hypothetical protein
MPLVDLRQARREIRLGWVLGLLGWRPRERRGVPLARLDRATEPVVLGAPGPGRVAVLPLWRIG